MKYSLLDRLPSYGENNLLVRMDFEVILKINLSINTLSNLLEKNGCGINFEFN